MSNTPPEVLEKWRKEFETENPIPNHIFWNGSEYDTKWPELTRADVKYNEYFNIWVTSRQTTVIELPKKSSPQLVDMYTSGHNDAIGACRLAIESKGYRVEVKV